MWQVDSTFKEKSTSGKAITFILFVWRSFALNSITHSYTKPSNQLRKTLNGTRIGLSRK